MPDNLKTGIENFSGYNMDDVKVHYNSDKPAQVQALAYTQGTDIHIASGQEKHLPHETWHVIQQKQGRVGSTIQLQGINVNDDEGLEEEACRVGAQIVQRNETNLDSVSLVSKKYFKSSKLIPQLKTFQFCGRKDNKRLKKIIKELRSLGKEVEDNLSYLSEGQIENIENMLAILRNLEIMRRQIDEIERLQIDEIERLQSTMLPEPISFEEFITRDKMRKLHAALGKMKWWEMVRRQHHSKGEDAYDSEKPMGASSPKNEKKYPTRAC